MSFGVRDDLFPEGTLEALVEGIVGAMRWFCRHQELPLAIVGIEVFGEQNVPHGRVFGKGLRPTLTYFRCRH